MPSAAPAPAATVKNGGAGDGGGGVANGSGTDGTPVNSPLTPPQRPVCDAEEQHRLENHANAVDREEAEQREKKQSVSIGLLPAWILLDADHRAYA